MNGYCVKLKILFYELIGNCLSVFFRISKSCLRFSLGNKCIEESPIFAPVKHVKYATSLSSFPVIFSENPRELKEKLLAD